LAALSAGRALIARGSRVTSIAVGDAIATPSLRVGAGAAGVYGRGVTADGIGRSVISVAGDYVHG
jgi:hypothetical protein